nr:MAG TPA: hypothetical protein [Caudoviricetes sp.]DAS33640.1 MAG TPA: hypothetical protein [Caudoviricetes sp.]
MIKGLRNTPRINTYSIFSIKSLNVSWAKIKKTDTMAGTL